MSTYVAMVIGCNNEKDILAKVWPYFLENEGSYTYHDVTEEVIEIVLSKYSISKNELFSFKDEIFKALVFYAYSHYDRFIDISIEGEDKVSSIKDNYYIKEDDNKYHFYKYAHKFPYIPWSAQIIDDEYLGNMKSYLTKKDIDLDNIFNNEQNELLARKLLSVVDINGVWHSLDDYQEEKQKILIQVLKDLPEDTPIAFLHYYD